MCDLYNISIPDLQYSSDFQYRLCILRAFHIPFDETAFVEEDDSEDELYELFSENEPTIQKCFDAIYEVTKNNTAFAELYNTAAEKTLFSNQPDLGMIVLFSYQYFALFHKCLIAFFNNPAIFTIENSNYKELAQSI